MSNNIQTMKIKVPLSMFNQPQILSQLLEPAACILRSGGIVAFPTETVYGLGASALDDVAVSKIFQAKGRPSDNPLIVHIADDSQLDELVHEIPNIARPLMKAFWPGPLTIIFKVKPNVSLKVTGGLGTVGIRIPSHPVALALLRTCNLPLAAPSANTSGKPSPTLPEHVLEDLDGRIDGIVEAGAAGIGVESTVIDIQTELNRIVICRPGGVGIGDLRRVVGDSIDVVFDPAVEFAGEKKDSVSAPVAPGMKYTHYAPIAPLFVIYGGPEEIKKHFNLSKQNHQYIGLMVTAETYEIVENCITPSHVEIMGRIASPQTISQRIYGNLRAFNSTNSTIILCEAIDCSSDQDISHAVMNRLLKASSGTSRSN